jgi:GntR family transcriptional repressor for pyruvate dehydrogenase complex
MVPSGGAPPARTGLAARPMPLSDLLVRRTLQLIGEEGLEPGDRLPSLKVLAERFGVATPTCREALRRLEANGVLEFRHGSGVYVRTGQERVVLANTNHGVIKAATVVNMLDARLLIEPHLAELAAANMTDATIAELDGLLAEAEQRLDDDERLHELNMGFHCTTAHLSGNDVLAQTIESYVELYSSEQMAVLSLYGHEGRPDDQRDHRNILGALRDRDGARARQLMYEHLAGVKSVAQKRFAAEA